MLDGMAARQRASLGQDGALGIGYPFRVYLEDGAAILGEALTQGLPEARPLVEVAIEDRPARGVVQGQSAGEAPPKHGGGRHWTALIDPEVARNSPAVARFEAAPRPGLQHGGIACLRDEPVPGGRVLADLQFGHALSA